MKVFNKKYLYSWATRDNAQSYIGKLGLFGDHLDILTNQDPHKLSAIDDGRGCCFISENLQGITAEHAFFVPLDKVIDLDDCVMVPRYFAWLLPGMCKWAIADRERFRQMVGTDQGMRETQKCIDSLEEFKRYLDGDYENEVIR